MLWGLLAGTIPIIIHLLNRRRYRPVPWAAMHFLLEAIRVNARRIQIEDLILLVLRILVLVLVALAFALPILRGSALLLGRQPHVCLVLLLDDSYSMNYVEGETSRFDRAREAARDVIGALRRGDSVSVILMSDRPRRLFREPTFDLDLARDLIGRLECSYAGSGADKALALAREDVSRARQPVRRICMISDFQKGLLRGPAVQVHLAALEEQAELIAIPVGGGYESNLALVDLRTDAGVVAVGVPTMVHARIRNFGQAAQKDYPVELYIDEQRRERRWVDIPPGGEVDVTFLADFREIGQHAIEVRLPADSLPTDNARHHVVDVRDKVPVLLISGDAVARGSIDATGYMGTALAPGWLLGETDEDRLSPVRVTPGQMRSSDLMQYPTVFLVNVPTLEPQQLVGLERYVRTGGGLMIVPGDRIDVRFYNDNLYRDGQGVLPARVVLPGFRSEPGDCFLSPEGFDHPVLSLFADRSHGDLTQTQFKRTLLLEAPTTSSVICKFSTGRPAIVERRYGKGRVMILAGGLGPEWGNFVWKSTFLVLARRATEYLMRRESEGLNLAVYEALTRFQRGGSAAQEMTVVAPNGEAGLAEVESGLGGVRIQYEAVRQPGVYRLSTEGQVVGRFAANTDPRESDLGLPPMGLAGTPFVRVEARDIRSATGSGGLGGSELWTTCLKAAIVLMLVEVLFLLYIEFREKRSGIHETA